MKDESGKEVQRIHDEMVQSVTAIRKMAASEHDQFGSYIIATMQSCLSRGTLFAWRESSEEEVEKVPSWESFTRFLQRRAISAESLPTEKTVPAKPKRSHTDRVGTYVTSNHKQPIKCCLCKEAHPLYVCEKFKRKTVSERRTLLNDQRCYFNCLRPGHRANQCMSSNRCKTCSRAHHTLVHLDSSQPQPTNNDAERPATVSVANIVQPCAVAGTCREVVTAPNSNTARVRALFDTGAEVPFITDTLATTLQLKKNKQKTFLTGIGGVPA